MTRFISLISPSKCSRLSANVVRLSVFLLGVAILSLQSFSSKHGVAINGRSMAAPALPSPQPAAALPSRYAAARPAFAP